MPNEGIVISYLRMISTQTRGVTKDTQFISTLVAQGMRLRDHDRATASDTARELRAAADLLDSMVAADESRQPDIALARANGA
jgi:hypothetical protein